MTPLMASKIFGQWPNPFGRVETDSRKKPKNAPGEDRDSFQKKPNVVRFLSATTAEVQLIQNRRRLMLPPFDPVRRDFFTNSSGEAFRARSRATSGLRATILVKIAITRYSSPRSRDLESSDSSPDAVRPFGRNGVRSAASIFVEIGPAKKRAPGLDCFIPAPQPGRSVFDVEPDLVRRLTKE
jgi:hypothetical protein